MSEGKRITLQKAAMTETEEKRSVFIAYAAPVKNEEEAKHQLIRAGYEPEVYTETKFKSVTEIEKLVGKQAFSAIFNGLWTQGEGSLTLAPESDKRIEYASADADFSDLVNE